jgi:hypothetical protein
MQPEFDPKLEAIIDQELRKLPELPAPRSLAPRVMAAIRARSSKPWWQQSWWNWPLAAQVTFLVIAVAIAGAFTQSGLIVDDSVRSYSQQVTEQANTVSTFLSNFQPLLNAVVVLWQKAQPLWLYAFALAIALYLACVGVGTIFVRVTLRRI